MGEPGTPNTRRAARDSPFEASAFERSGDSLDGRAYAWRRQALVMAAMLGCLAVFVLARWLAAAPHLGGEWSAGPGGTLVLQEPARGAAGRSHTVLAIGQRGEPPVAVDALLLHRWPRWQVDGQLRARQLQQHEALAQMLTRGEGQVLLHLADGSLREAPVSARGYAGLGWMFWPLTGLALVMYLFAVVLVLSRPQPRNALFVVMTLSQAGNLLFIALESAHGLGLPAGTLASDLPVRATLDLCTAAATVHAFALRPAGVAGMPNFPRVALVAWAVLPLWWLVVALNDKLGGALPLWWLAQGGCLALGATALAVARRSQRLHPDAHGLLLRRMATAALATLALVTLAVALAAKTGGTGPAVAAAASATWYLFLASLLLLTPFLARRRQLLREFALLAGVSTIVTSLDLLFVAVFSLGAFTSLAVAVFIGLGLYAAARQWALQQLIGTSVLSTERTFDHLYRAARELQAHPQRYPQLLAQLMREIFDPLEVQAVDRVPVRARLLGGGSALVLPMRQGDDGHSMAAVPSRALVLRHAQRGQRLFTVEDARLADRVVEQLRRAVAYDAAVERGRFEERQRIAQDLHDDIGARLLTLMYQAQTREMEDYIRHTLQDLKTLTRGLAAAEHRLSHAAGEWKADLTQRLSVAQATLDWVFQVDHDRRLTVVQWSALTRVLRELVSNALFHGHATHVEVNFRLEGPLLRLQVADDGEGRAPEAWAHGLGLGGVRKRVKLLGGEVVWSENQPRGIVCTVRVPDFPAGR